MTGRRPGLGRRDPLEDLRRGRQRGRLDRDADAGDAPVAQARRRRRTAVFHAGDVPARPPSRRRSSAAAKSSAPGHPRQQRRHRGRAAPYTRPPRSDRQRAAVNLKGAFFGCKYAVQAMQAGGGGSIVNIGSIVSLVGDPPCRSTGRARRAFSASRRSIAVDYAEDGIRCNMICPGDMVTPMLLRTFESDPRPRGQARRDGDLLPAEAHRRSARGGELGGLPAHRRRLVHHRRLARHRRRADREMLPRCLRRS